MIAQSAKEPPDGWQETRLGEVVVPRTQRIDPADAPEAPFIGLEHVEPGTMRLLGQGSARDVRSSANRFRAGDVLYGRLRPYLNKVVRTSFDGLCSAEFVVLQPKVSISPEFLAHRLSAADVVSFAMSFNVGVHRPRVRWEQLREFTFGLPPPAVQDRIVSATETQIGRIERGVAELAAAYRALDKYRVAILQACLQGADSRMAPLLDVVEVLDRFRVPINRKERASRKGDVPYYGATGQVGWIDDHLFDEELVLLGEDGVGFLDPSEQKAYIIRGKSWVNNHAHVLRPKSSSVSTAYVCHALNAINYADVVGGTTRLKLTQAGMRRIKIPVPPPTQQAAIVSIINGQLSLRAHANSEIATAREHSQILRQAVLTSAMRGDLGKSSLLASRSGADGSWRE